LRSRINGETKKKYSLDAIEKIKADALKEKPQDVERSRAVLKGIVSAHSAGKIWNGRIPPGYEKVITYGGAELKVIRWDKSGTTPRGDTIESDLRLSADCGELLSAIRDSFDARLAGAGAADIKRDFDARRLKMASGEPFDVTAIKRIWQRPIYKGLVVIGRNSKGLLRVSEFEDPDNGTVGLAPFERPDLKVVEPDIWDKVQTTFATEDERPKIELPPGTFLLSGGKRCNACEGTGCEKCHGRGWRICGGVRCATCGGPMSPTVEDPAPGETKERPVYRCRSHSRYPGIHGDGPAYPAVPRKALEDVVVAKLEGRKFLTRESGRLPKRPNLARQIADHVNVISVLVQKVKHRLGRKTKTVSGKIHYADRTVDEFTMSDFDDVSTVARIEKLLESGELLTCAEISRRLGHSHPLSARPSLAMAIDLGRIKKHPTKCGYCSPARWLADLPKIKPIQCGPSLAKTADRLLDYFRRCSIAQTKATISSALGYARDRGADKVIEVLFRAGLIVKSPTTAGYILNPRLRDGA
jgi:hypothetical protein